MSVKLKSEPEPGAATWETAFGHPREFLDNRFVYVVISSRTRGLSVGVNLNPDRQCNFDCVYCEVDRSLPIREPVLDVDVMADELERTVSLALNGGLRECPGFATVPEDLMQLRHVALSGDGEPTLCPQFSDAVQSVVHVRARGGFPYFKMVLITNASGLDQPQVREGLRFFTKEDEVWAKLDGGSEAYLKRINRTDVPLEHVMSNILELGRRRPVVIQSLFPLYKGQEPSEMDLLDYTDRLRELQNGGAQIRLVQVYSCSRPTLHPDCAHLPLRTLSAIARVVRERTGLDARVY